MQTRHKLAYAKAWQQAWQLRYAFQNGQGGGLYLPLVAYQDTGLVTPSDAESETIAAIVDQKTASETFTTFYTSDFATGLSGFSAVNGTADFNIDGVQGLNDWLRLTVGSSGSTSSVTHATGFYGTTRNRIILQVYMPSGQPYCDGFGVFSGSGDLLLYNGINNGSTGPVISIDGTAYMPFTPIQFYAYDGASSTINAAAAGELLYIRAVTTSYSNLLNFWMPTAPSQPRMGILPKGRTVRNLFTTTTATLTTRNFTTSAVQYTMSMKGTGTITLTHGNQWMTGNWKMLAWSYCKRLSR